MMILYNPPMICAVFKGPGDALIVPGEGIFQVRSGNKVLTRTANPFWRGRRLLCQKSRGFKGAPGGGWNLFRRTIQQH